MAEGGKAGTAKWRRYGAMEKVWSSAYTVHQITSMLPVNIGHCHLKILNSLMNTEIKHIESVGTLYLVKNELRNVYPYLRHVMVL